MKNDVYSVAVGLERLKDKPLTSMLEENIISMHDYQTKTYVYLWVHENWSLSSSSFFFLISVGFHFLASLFQKFHIGVQFWNLIWLEVNVRVKVAHQQC